jgi:RES domain-containing protein
MGDCDYCQSKGVALIYVGKLYDPFKNLMQLYTPSDDENGEMLAELIQCGYEVFEDNFFTSGRARQLFEDIMESGWDDDDGEPLVRANDLYKRRSSLWTHTTMVEAWEDFCYQVKQDPAHEPSLPPLFEEDLARMEVPLSDKAILYRSRKGYEIDDDGNIQPYRGSKIGAPPPDKATAGRANAKGEVVLYVADQEATAIAESRPWRGLLVSVAEINTVSDLRLVDLSVPPQADNPFIDEAPQYESEFVELLRAFGEELGRPLRREDDVQDYLPSQKLVHRIRDCGFYDGIRYPSAMAPNGTNMVLFDPSLAHIGPSKLVEVQDVNISYDAI